MLARPSFLADIVQPSARENISCAIAFGVRSALALLADLDEVRVLREPAGVEEEGLAGSGRTASARRAGSRARPAARRRCCW